MNSDSMLTTQVLQDCEVVLQAGGSGQRIQPLSDFQPKPLLPVCGIPMIERLFRQIVSAGFYNITIITGYGKDAITMHIENLVKVLPRNLRVRFYYEHVPLGNLGALGEINTDGKLVLSLFADLVTDLDFVHLLQTHRKRACDITLTSHYEQYRLRLGEITVAGERVIDYQEKPAKEFLACSGIVVFEPIVIKLARELPRPFGLSDLVQAALDKGHAVTHWTHGAFWHDVNTENELQETEAKLTELQTRNGAISHYSKR
jgi:NDP-mannose synthase